MEKIRSLINGQEFELVREEEDGYVVIHPKTGEPVKTASKDTFQKVEPTDEMEMAVSSIADFITI